MPLQNNSLNTKPTLTSDQLQTAIASGKQRFDLIKKKYPPLKAYLVFSSPAGQAPIDSEPAKLLKLFPAMVVDDAAKTKGLELLSVIESLEWHGKVDDAKELGNKLSQLVRQFSYEGKTQIEIRFNELNYALNWKLQTDELVDRSLTPQGQASIRIVLGTILSLLPA